MNTTAHLTMTSTRSSRMWIFAAATMGLGWYIVDDWIGACAVGVLWLAWRTIRDDDGLPILAMALTFQWVQVTSGVWYHALTGRPLATIALSDYRPMVLIGLGCVAALTVGFAAFGVLLIAISLFWIGVRTEYRKEFDNETFAQSRSMQFDKMAQLSTDWWKNSHNMLDDMDRLVDRMWVVYYPALAVSRVPSVLPHTDGAFVFAAVQHVLSPRVLFPTKAELKSDSEMVRKYSGVWVAGAEQNTSIAFGYAGESYIDFGVPLMFMPVFLYGLVAGLAYQTLSTRLHHGEVRSGLLAVIFWLALYLFERSWVKTIGLLGTLLVYLGGPALLLDYYLNRFDVRRRGDAFDRATEQWT